MGVMKKKDNPSRTPVVYYDDIHCIYRKEVGRSFKTVYSVETRYKSGTGRIKTYTSNYGTFGLAESRYVIETDCSDRGRMKTIDVSLISTSYIGGKVVGREVLHKRSYASKSVYDRYGNYLGNATKMKEM